MLDSPDGLTWRRIRRGIDEPGTETPGVDFLLRTYGTAAIDEAWSEFTGGDEPFSPSTPHIVLFTSWLLHRWSPEPGTTADASLSGRVPMEVYLERADRRLDPAARRYWEASLNMPFSFHEALRCDPGQGFQVRDMFTGRERYVFERMASRQMQAGDILFGLVLDVDGISMLDSAGACFIPPIRKIELLDFRKTLLRNKTHFTSEELLDWDYELIDRYLLITEELLHPRIPALRNTDGEALQFNRLVFDIDSPEAAIRALADLAPGQTADELIAGAERTVRGQIKRVKWTWQKAGNAMHGSWDHTILGHLEIKSRRLTAEVNSARRAAELREIIESRLGKQARFRANTIESVERMLARHAERDLAEDPAQPIDLSQHPELEAEVRKMMAQHFEHWVSESIPALDGLTPLEAVKDPEGREKVLALVVDAERHARQMTPPVDEAVLQRLRARLGLPPQP